MCEDIIKSLIFDPIIKFNSCINFIQNYKQITQNEK